MKKNLMALFLVFTLAITSKAQTPSVIWSKTFGGSGEEIIKVIEKTSDGGFIAVGSTDASTGQAAGSHGSNDLWVIKVDNAGTYQWHKCLGGTLGESASSIKETNDGGFIIGGTTSSNNGDVSGAHGNVDCWVVKLSSTGSLQWQKALGGYADESIASSFGHQTSVRQTSDNGFIVATNTQSNDGDLSGPNKVSADIWVVKLSSAGNIQWQKCYGDSLTPETANDILITKDKGYMVAGRSNGDYYLMKLDSVGTFKWGKKYGGTNLEAASSLQPTVDGGYILAGYSQSNNGDITTSYGSDDFWVVKVDSLGTKQWQKSLGGGYGDWCYEIKQASDGGYIMIGETASNTGLVTGNHGTYDGWLVKLDNGGNLVWKKCLGGSDDDACYSFQLANDGSIVVVGYSYSNDGNLLGSVSHGGGDGWIIKLTNPGMTGIEEINEELQLSLYPNPATNELYINFSGAQVEQVNIYNTTGSLVSQTNLPQSKGIDISALPNGIYITEVVTREASAKRRWVKM